MQQHMRSTKCLAEGIENNGKQNEKPTPIAIPSVSIFGMFRLTDKTDYVLMAIGTLGALGLGASTPFFVLFWGDFTNVFGQSNDQIVTMAWESFKKFLYLACGTFVAGLMMITCWLISGERQANLCRKTYFAQLLRQQIGWFDCVNQSELSSKFTSDVQSFQAAIGEKVAMVIHVTGSFIGGFTIAFVQGWLMTLVCLAAFPVIGIAGYFYMHSLEVKNAEFDKFYSKAGGLSEQAFSSIKTVKQLNGEVHEEKTYEDCLGDVKAKNINFGVKIAASMAFLNGAMFLIYALGYWFGGNCADPTNSTCPVVSGKLYSPGDVITVFFAILVACFNLSQMSPALATISEGMSAASRIFAILDRQPKIVSPQNAIKPTEFKGNIKFQNVTFAYPKDKKKVVLNNLTIEFHVNNTALVGESGCGKSTILQLIMRFYDPDSGRVLLDGVDLRDLDLIWLRNQIGYVGQEPVLFATTIRENLYLGYENATEEEIKQALRQVEAYDFVFNQLEKGLQTYVGSGGGQISGGQKQRIAIARALLKKPKILLLDEATSALDRRNEKLIQNTLNKVSAGLTTVTVAHRVQSIMNANIIYVINRGEIEEKGEFQQLKRYKDFNSKEADEKEQEKNVAQHQIVNKSKQQKEKEQADAKIKEQMERERIAQLVKRYENGLIKRIFSHLSNHRLSFVFGILLSIALALTYPIFSFFLSDILKGLFLLKYSDTHDQGRRDVDTASVVFLILAIGTFIVNLFRDLLAYIVGDQITNNIRRQAYSKMLKMPVAWFDQSNNNCGILSKRLGADCRIINGMATTYIYTLIGSFTAGIAAIVISFIFQWRLALIAIGLMPLVMLSGAVRAALGNGRGPKQEACLKEATQIVMEALTNIRTVTSFGVQNTMLNKYCRLMDQPQSAFQKNHIIAGFLFGLSQATTFIVFGVLFYVGTIFIRDNGSKPVDVFTVVYEIFFAGITIGHNQFHFMPDVNEAKTAAAHIFEILDSEDEEQIQQREKSLLIKEGIKGHIKLENVKFKYDSRNQQILRNISLEVLPGQKVAFVGPSGCGKTTILQLLQRFYFPQSGKISIDGIDLKDYDVHYLRSRFGVVSQQPVLFNSTFRQNIKYNKYDATEEDIKKASTLANALTFIQGDQKLHIAQEVNNANVGNIDTPTPGQGFERNVGIKGSHISGGQKQRVAIARAILRTPQILLLDEATSALDAQNQLKVQQSLDRIMEGKTTITISHRIQTIKKSDTIKVFEKGEIVQSGSYDQLLSMKGFFYNLERGTQFI